MDTTNVKWIRIFDISDVNKHKKGFTIYKVTSMLYPESCPDAVTKLTVWKRYNEFKKLHKEMKVLHKKLNIQDKFPSLPRGTFFKRFDQEILQERSLGALNFLEYIGSHQHLFTSTEFVKFFETSHTPIDLLNGNINSIRADLNLPDDPEYVRTHSDEEQRMSDTDSISTSSSLSPSVQTDLFPSLDHSTTKLNKLRKLSSNTSITSQTTLNLDNISIATVESMSSLLDGHVYPTPPHTPGLNVESHIQYIVDASVHINIAVELENDKKYEGAFVAYKTAIDILLRYGKDDKNYDRKRIVRYKTEKYLLRAEKIYNMYLAPEVKNLGNIDEKREEKVEKTPVSDLYKYKVVRTIGSGMLVIHSETQQIFFIKVIHKTTKFLNENLILPENVPYMVKLYNYYNCDNALFLILQYCSGLKLSEYLKQKSNKENSHYQCRDEILEEVYNLELSDNESEKSFSDLINNYTQQKVISESMHAQEQLEDSDDSYEQVNADDLRSEIEYIPKNIMDEPLAPEEGKIYDALTMSQQLISSVDCTLQMKEELDEENTNLVTKKENVYCDKNSFKESSQRKISTITTLTSFDEIDYMQNFIPLPEDTVKWSAQILLALEKLHALGVICKDLQTYNLLLNEDGDMMVTYMCNVKETIDMSSCVEYSLFAPEVYGFESLTEAVDWWSYGSVLYELLVGVPLSVIHPEGLLSYTILKIPRYVSPEGRSLLRQLLAYKAADRLGSGVQGVENIKSHPFFSGIHWDTLLIKYNN